MWRLGGQADVQGVAGTVEGDLTDSVNSMASNLTGQVRNIAEVTDRAAGRATLEEDRGGRRARSPSSKTRSTRCSGPARRHQRKSRVSRGKGTEGKLGGQAQVQGVAGTLERLTDSVNLAASNLTSQVRNIAVR